MYRRSCPVRRDESCRFIHSGLVDIDQRNIRCATFRQQHCSRATNTCSRAGNDGFLAFNIHPFISIPVSRPSIVKQVDR